MITLRRVRLGLQATSVGRCTPDDSQHMNPRRSKLRFSMMQTLLHNVPKMKETNTLGAGAQFLIENISGQTTR